MKQILSLIVILIISVGQLCAQPGRKSKPKHRTFDIENFKKQKADFIVAEANLTPSEATVFIPLMDELLQKKFELNRKVRNESRLLKKKENPSASDYDTYLELSVESRIQEAVLDKEYYEKFKKILPAEKIYKYQQAETKFMRETINKDLKKK